jgi:hypothetical protein
MVVDNIQYDVQIHGIEKAIQKIAKRCALAESGLKRREMLVSHLTRRAGAYVLFSLEPRPESGMELLTKTDGDNTPMERFSSTSEETPDSLGWSATASRYENTFAGEIRNNDLFDSFRRVEEDAIYDMARNIVAQYTSGKQQGSTEDPALNSSSSLNIRLTIKGLRIDRRKVDLKSNNCIVTISAPIDGVSIDKVSANK